MKNMFLQKPISKNYQEAQEIFNATKKYNKILQVGSNHRFFESVLYAKISR